MRNPSGSFRAPKLKRRFEKFIRDLIGERRKNVSSDDALGELLKRAEY